MNETHVCLGCGREVADDEVVCEQCLNERYG